MEFTKKEKELLSIEKFFNDLKGIFPNISYISLETVGFSKDRYNPSENLLPVCIDIKYEADKWALYAFLTKKPNTNIENATAYNIDGNAVEYEEVKNTIFKLLPDFFKTKVMYKNNSYSINTETIDELLEPIKRKLMLLELSVDLNTNLPLNNKNKKKHKI